MSERKENTEPWAEPRLEIEELLTSYDDLDSEWIELDKVSLATKEVVRNRLLAGEQDIGELLGSLAEIRGKQRALLEQQENIDSKLASRPLPIK